MMDVEAESMSSAEGESCAWQCLAQLWLQQVLPPPCAVAFFPVSAGDEGQPHFPCLPCTGASICPVACL